MRAYCVVDVFTTLPMQGNPVAVVLDAEGLSAQDMQTMARWINLSETTFVLPASDKRADYRLRIFTPVSELPFAGHPTLGSAHAVLASRRLELGEQGRLVQECGAGLIDVAVQTRQGRTEYALGLPKASFEELSDEQLHELTDILGVAFMGEWRPLIVDVGARWVIAAYEDRDRLRQLRPHLERLQRWERQTGVHGVTVYAATQEHGPRSMEVRSFAPSQGIVEDPVCGSGNGCVAAFRAKRDTSLKAPFVLESEQGWCVERRGRVSLRCDHDARIEVAGQCVTVVHGRIRGPSDDLDAGQP